MKHFIIVGNISSISEYLQSGAVWSGGLLSSSGETRRPVQPVRCAVAGGAVCLQFKSSSAHPCLSTGDSVSRSISNMPDKKWQKQKKEGVGKF